MEGPFNTIGAYTYAAAVELQILGGVPVTHLVADFVPGDTFLKVRSTLGFPPSGYLRGPAVRFYYASKTPTRFQDLIYETLVPLPVQTIMASDVKRLEPSSYELFWGMPWEGNDYLVDVGE